MERMLRGSIIGIRFLGIITIVSLAMWLEQGLYRKYWLTFWSQRARAGKKNAFVCALGFTLTFTFTIMRTLALAFTFIMIDVRADAAHAHVHGHVRNQ